MNNKKHIGLWVAVGLLLCLNLATIGWIFSRARQFRANRDHPEARLISRLDLTADQQTRYRQLRADFEQRSQPYQDSVLAIRNQLFGQFSRALPDDQLDVLVGRLERHNGQLTRLRFRHWQQVRALCTPRQQVRFDRMARQFSSQMPSKINQ